MSESNCAVQGCFNNYHNSKEMIFYSFPFREWETERRELWAKFCRRTTRSGQPWKPTKMSKMCSRHFVGNKKSQHPHSPSYDPTIFQIKETNRTVKRLVCNQRSKVNFVSKAISLQEFADLPLTVEINEVGMELEADVEEANQEEEVPDFDGVDYFSTNDSDNFYNENDDEFILPNELNNEQTTQLQAPEFCSSTNLCLETGSDSVISNEPQLSPPLSVEEPEETVDTRMNKKSRRKQNLECKKINSSNYSVGQDADEVTIPADNIRAATKFPCSACSSTFSTRSGHRIHWSTVHCKDDQKNIVKCPPDNGVKSFPPVLVSQPTKPASEPVKLKYTCILCQQSFDQGSKLNGHKDVCTRDSYLMYRDRKPESIQESKVKESHLIFGFSCPLSNCGKKFDYSNDLYVHLRLHNQPKKNQSVVQGNEKEEKEKVQEASSSTKLKIEKVMMKYECKEEYEEEQVEIKYL